MALLIVRHGNVYPDSTRQALKYPREPGEITSSGIVLQANSDMGNVNEISESATVEGKELKIALNGKYLLDALKAVKGEQAALSFNTAMAPYTVTGVDEQTNEYLMMPVKMDN